MVAEPLELADQAAGMGSGVVTTGEPVGTEVLIDSIGVGEALCVNLL